MLDYREWEFKKDARFRNARLRLGKAETTTPLRAGEPTSGNMYSTCSAAFESNMSLPMRSGAACALVLYVRSKQLMLEAKARLSPHRAWDWNAGEHANTLRSGLCIGFVCEE
jgi:hypothetical protein